MRAFAVPHPGWLVGGLALVRLVQLAREPREPAPAPSCPLCGKPVHGISRDCARQAAK